MRIGLIGVGLAVLGLAVWLPQAPVWGVYTRFDCATLPTAEHRFKDNHMFIRENPAYLGAQITQIRQIDFDNPATLPDRSPARPS